MCLYTMPSLQHMLTRACAHACTHTDIRITPAHLQPPSPKRAQERRLFDGTFVRLDMRKLCELTPSSRHTHMHTHAHLAFVTNLPTYPCCTSPLPQERRQFDEKFVRLDTRKLCELTSAADSLEMRPLVDMTSRALARLIEGKSPDEIREAFNLPDDLTEEEKLEPVKNLVDDPRIRLLNRLYAKKRKVCGARACVCVCVCVCVIDGGGSDGSVAARVAGGAIIESLGRWHVHSAGVWWGWGLHWGWGPQELLHLTT